MFTPQAQPEANQKPNPLNPRSTPETPQKPPKKSTKIKKFSTTCTPVRSQKIAQNRTIFKKSLKKVLTLYFYYDKIIVRWGARASNGKPSNPAETYIFTIQRRSRASRQKSVGSCKPNHENHHAKPRTQATRRALAPKSNQVAYCV